MKLKTQITLVMIIFIFVLLSDSGAALAQTSGCHPLDFNLPSKYQAGQYAFNITPADLNGDGNVDVILPSGNIISVLYGDGAGGFTPPTTFLPGIQSVSTVAVGDINMDGKTDIVAASSGVTFNNNKIVVLLNNGEGGFLAPIFNDLPNNVIEFYDLKVGDFNGDNNPDVVGLTRTNLNFLLGNGQGNFSLNTTIQWNGNRNGLVVGNFNNDSYADVAFTGGSFGTPWEFGITLGTSGNSFIINNRYNLTGQPSGIESGDFNTDGQTDIVISADYTYSNSTPQTHFLEPWIGTGNGSFSAGTKSQFPIITSGVSKGDFNSDGKVDLAVNLNSVIGIVYGSGTGIFQDPTYFLSPGSNKILSTDLNHDNKSDLLMLRSNTISEVSVALNSVSGFSIPRLTSYSGNEMTATDLNNDNFLDVVTAYRSEFVYTSNIVYSVNNGQNELQEIGYQETPVALTAIASGDFNGDGNKDVISTHSNNSRKIATYFGNGTGNLTPSSQQFTWNRGIQNGVTGDFNRDGKEDVFIIDELSNGYILTSLGNGNFSVVESFSIGSIRFNVTPVTGDFNQDGKIDLALVVNNSLTLWLGNEGGTFTQSTEQPLTSFESLAKGDFNGDGNLDVASLGNSATTVLTKFFGNGSGNFTSNFSQTINGQSSSVTSGDFNADGYDDLAFINSGFLGNLVIVPSNEQATTGLNPLYYSVGGLSSVIIAEDFNNDGRTDISFFGSQFKGIITGIGGQTACVSINDVNVTEGDNADVTANFNVSLSAASTQDVYVNYTLEGQSATLGTDFENISGRLKIQAGQTSANIPVTIKGDLIDEFDETFVVHLSGPLNAYLQKPDALGTIVDNDAEPSLTIADVTANEGSFSSGFTFNATLSAPSAKPISFRYATTDGTATAGSDYVSSNFVFNIPAGTASVNIFVTVLGDNMYEPDEDFFVNISEPVNVSLVDNQGRGTIINDDSVPTLNIFSGSVIEGDIGTRNVQVTLQLSNPTYLPVTFNVLTSDGTAIAGRDYIVADTPVTIAAGQQLLTTNVQIIGDTINEPNETLFANLYNVSNATINNTQTQISIIDDEPVVNDFDRDGKADIAVFRPDERTWYILYSFNNSFSALQYGLSDDILATGDYNGDNRTDITVWRPSTGVWYSTAPNQTHQWGLIGDIPVQGDYDNDGKTDVAVFRPSTKNWYIKYSSSSESNIVQWGLENDTPVPADYDGDGKTDIAVYRSKTGVWYILRSRDGGLTALQFGLSTDQAVPADYDGDGKADIAVYRNGIWYVHRSSDNTDLVFQWGIEGDKPVPGNYDGDEKTDFAVYRNGIWWIWLSSTNSLTTRDFGLSSDIPIPFVSNY